MRCMAFSIHLPTAWAHDAIAEVKQIMEECASKGQWRPTRIIIAGEFNDIVRAETVEARILQEWFADWNDQTPDEAEEANTLTSAKGRQWAIDWVLTNGDAEKPSISEEGHIRSDHAPLKRTLPERAAMVVKFEQKAPRPLQGWMASRRGAATLAGRLGFLGAEVHRRRPRGSRGGGEGHGGRRH